MLNNLEIFRCPICQEKLAAEGKSLKCSNRHCFDIASEGYVNLLTHGRSGSGDSKEMIAARHDFLQKGYYSCFREALAQLVIESLRESGCESPLIVDAGCGEGYYLSGIYAKAAQDVPLVRAAGVDLSLAAVKRAAKKDRGLFFAVASVFELPLAEESTDVLLSIFAPINEFGFKRVLKRGGRLIIAAPGKRHLFGLKEVLYENPYENEENLFQFDGFEYKKSHFVKREIYLENTSDVMNLFMMTPYYWKTSQNGVKRLGELKELNTTIEFEFIDLERK